MSVQCVRPVLQAVPPGHHRWSLAPDPTLQRLTDGGLSQLQRPGQGRRDARESMGVCITLSLLFLHSDLASFTSHTYLIQTFEKSFIVD